MKMIFINSQVLKRISHLRNDTLLVNWCLRKLCTNQREVEVSYPAILDTSFEAKKARERKKWHDKIKALPTVEEKLLEINMPSYYGWKSLNLSEGVIPYDSLGFTQFITRTHFIQTDDIPTKVNRELDNYCSEWVAKLKPLVNDVLLFDHYNKRTSTDNEFEAESSIVKQLNSLIVASMTTDAPHLAEAQIDYDPRVEAFWVVGGMEPTNWTVKSRKGQSWLKDMVNAPENRNIQYVGYPVLQLRHAEPLCPIIELSESENPDLTVPYFQYDPRVLGLQLQRRHGTSIPGFWPGDPCEFSLMSFHGRNHMKERPEAYGAEEHAEALHCQAILASYGWLLPIACYQGFSTFNDVTYPLVSQTVITDGKMWSFYSYQLNTTLLHNENFKENARRNICWGTPSMKLFENIEGDKIIGFNDDVLRNLVKLYLNTPQERDIEMKPYLSKYKYVSNIQDEEKREWLETRFKHLYSLRPRHRPMPEIYHWEKIYKIDHKTRPMEPKRRPFELGINPFKRRLDEHTPAYIPKQFREDKKKKWAKTYYPK